MSGRELQRIEVLSEVLARQRTEISAAAILGLSTRQTRRLLTAYRDLEIISCLVALIMILFEPASQALRKFA